MWESTCVMRRSWLEVCVWLLVHSSIHPFIFILIILMLIIIVIRKKRKTNGLFVSKNRDYFVSVFVQDFLLNHELYHRGSIEYH